MTPRDGAAALEGRLLHTGGATFRRSALRPAGALLQSRWPPERLTRSGPRGRIDAKEGPMFPLKRRYPGPSGAGSSLSAHRRSTSLVLLDELSFGPPSQRFIIAYGSCRRASRQGSGGQLRDLFTSMFLHGGWRHLGGTCCSCGSSATTSRIVGAPPLLVFYLLTEGRGLRPHRDQPGSTVPPVGASGAIAGVLGGYIVMFPRARVQTLLPTFHIMLIPAV